MPGSKAGGVFKPCKASAQSGWFPEVLHQQLLQPREETAHDQGPRAFEDVGDLITEIVCLSSFAFSKSLQL